jgi:hypothetical protein
MVAQNDAHWQLERNDADATVKRVYDWADPNVKGHYAVDVRCNRLRCGATQNEIGGLLADHEACGVQICRSGAALKRDGIRLNRHRAFGSWLSMIPGSSPGTGLFQKAATHTFPDHGPSSPAAAAMIDMPENYPATGTALR